MALGRIVGSGAPAAHPTAPLATLVPSAPLPPPLVFAEDVLGGERAIVADLHSSTPEFDAPHPFFLTPAQFSVLEGFLRRSGPIAPSLLMVSGTIKSGKSRILTDIIPRLLSLHYSQAPPAAGAATARRRRPVIFHHLFAHGADSAAATERWQDELLSFARSLRIPLDRPQGIAAHGLRLTARALAARIHAEGGQLWLLLDEVGAPIVASPAGEAAAFVQLLKDTLTATHPYARMVATGSGMVSLLKAMADAAPNGYTLWGAATHVRVGQEPLPAAALAMAQRLHAAYAPAWPPALQEHATPARLVRSLAFGAHGGLTSPRPALLAFLAERLGLAAATGSPAEALFGAALQDVLFKLSRESRNDAAVGLERMQISERRALRELAVHGRLPQEYPFSSFASVLCEDGGVAAEAAAAAAAAALAASQEGPTVAAKVQGQQRVLLRLMPPYAALLQRWIRADGWLSISSRGARQPLVPRVQQTLVTLHEHRRDFGAALLQAISDCVLRGLAETSIGVPVARGGMRPPGTVGELSALPAIAHLLRELDLAAAMAAGEEGQAALSPKPSPTAEGFRQAAAAGAEGQAKFMALAGVHVLQLLRNYCAHASLDSKVTQQCGLREAVVDEVVRRAALEVVKAEARSYSFDEHGALLRRREPL